MKSILGEFARGNINQDVYFLKQGSQHEKSLKTLLEYQKALLPLLGETEKALFEKFVDTENEISLLSNVDQFIHGYRLGVLMTMEVFTGLED